MGTVTKTRIARITRNDIHRQAQTVKATSLLKYTALALGLCAAALLPSTASAQATSGATLRLVVKDPTGAVIPGALVQVRGAEAATETITREDLPSDGQGVALVEGLRPGRYIVQVDFPGFEALVIPDVRVRNGENRRDVTLMLAKYDESVSVGRDPAAAAADPQSDRFNTVLGRNEIEALPDDPDEMERVLQQMAGPGATIRVDGFRGGRLPPKSQIRSIRFSRDQFAAENHGGGMVFVDIVTQPGLGPLRGGLDFNFRDGALNARNAYQPEKGPEQTQQYTFNLSGTLRRERTSFSISANAASLYDSANVFAATPDGSRQAPIRRPSDRQNFNGRLDHALSRGHTLRVNFQQNANDQRNLGVGTFDLPERAYQRSSTDRVLRLSENGPWSSALFGETRLQLRWQSSESSSAVDAPTIRVLDAFTSGGAQQAGGRDATEVEWATNVDWATGKHSVRAGVLIEAGVYNSDSRTNYLGTYTFASLEDYEAGLPTTYTRRIGDPFVRYNQWQAGLYVQDDWRARQNLTLSAGLRKELQTNLDDKLNLAPRFGMTWSPFAHGRTTVRAGGGIFYDWLESSVYEQTLRVDGQRQQELIIRNPGYPDPFTGGTLLSSTPGSKYVVSDDLVMPRRTMFTTGVSHQLSPRLGSNLSYTHTRGAHAFRGRLLNTPGPDGVRPDPAVGNITQVESTASSRGNQISGGINFMIPERRTFLFANYIYARHENDADGPFSLPANSQDLSGEWGPAAGRPRHMFTAMVNTALPKSIRVGLTLTGRSGSPYNITTGRDDNGDTVFNDRPAGVGRNSARGDATWDLGGRISYSFGFGTRNNAGGGGMLGQPMVVRVGGGGDVLGGLPGGGAENKRIRFEIFASASNLLNTVNRIGYSGVMTSPFFGQATGAMPGRRIDLGARIGF
jgi:hypothetical protein